jgi:hypothetical protein
LLGRMGNAPKTFAIRSNSEAELVRREIQEIRDALEAFKVRGLVGTPTERRANDNYA